MRRFGVWIASVALLATSGCLYTFSGGGLPGNVHTMAISTFDNQTASPDIPKELYDSLHTELERRLGVRDASPDRANAIVRGTIQSYDADVPVGFSANPQQAVTATRHLQITVDIEIVDQSNGHVIFAQKGIREESDYAERQEDVGRQKAIQKIVEAVIEGVQSNW